MKNLILFLSLYLASSLIPTLLLAQNCSGPSRTEPLFSLEGRVIQGPDGCLLGTDVNNGSDAGYKFDKDAGAYYGLGPINNSIDAYNFLRKCLGEFGVYTENVGVSSSHPDFESELARCNSILFGEEFIVKRFALSLSGINQSMLSFASLGQSLGCYVMMEFDFSSGGAHAVGLSSASSDGKKFSLKITDANFPDEPQSLSGKHSDPVSEVVGDDYKKLMGKARSLIFVRGIIFKCPVLFSDILLETKSDQAD